LQQLAARHQVQQGVILGAISHLAARGSHLTAKRKAGGGNTALVHADIARHHAECGGFPCTTPLPQPPAGRGMGRKPRAE